MDAGMKGIERGMNDRGEGDWGHQRERFMWGGERGGSLGGGEEHFNIHLNGEEKTLDSLFCKMF